MKHRSHSSHGFGTILTISVTILILFGLFCFIDQFCWGYARDIPENQRQWRQLVVNTAKSWYGAKEGSQSHREIVDIYNDHKPLARGYELQYDDDWCSAFVSTVSIQCGMTELLPTECGCEPQIERFLEAGAWVEDDAYVPLPGDCIFYHWDDHCTEDCTARSDHVGIVIGTFGNRIKVIEGNQEDAVRYRIVRIDDPSIRGFGVPEYEKMEDAPRSVEAMDLQNTSAGQTVTAFAESHGLAFSDYPESLVALLMRNPETETFVLEYPLKHDQRQPVDLSSYSRETVPLFMQWDSQWGYIQYGEDVAGLTACGPVCLSMAAYYLTGDTSMSPDHMIQFAIDNGYCVRGSGSAWKLISEGAVKLGFDVTEIPLDQDRIFRNLEVENPIICVMGPGDFTTTGHFIVMTGIQDGKLVINDPNSHKNSETLWDYQQIKDQIRNLWVIRK